MAYLVARSYRFLITTVLVGSGFWLVLRVFSLGQWFVEQVRSIYLNSDVRKIFTEIIIELRKKDLQTRFLKNIYSSLVL